MDGNATVTRGEQLGLLLGPEPQSEDLLIEGAIPLNTEFRFARSLAILLAGVESVHPMLAEAQRERSHTILGLYRILARGSGPPDESCLEFLATNGQERSSLSHVRCCFEFAPLSRSQTSLRALMRKGERWEQIQEITLQSELTPPRLKLKPPASLRPNAPVMRLKRLERQRLAENVRAVVENFNLKNRFWVDIAILALLLLLTTNTFLLWFVRRGPRETTSLQPLSDQIGELRAAVSKLRPPDAAAPVHPDALVPADAPVHPDAPSTKALSRKADVPRRQVSNQPFTANRIAIAKKPTVLRPAEAFQFKVNGNPAPEVVWASEGPGSIDSVYGLYRAPDRFTGETRVKVTATSWAGSQSVTFTLLGTSRETR
jgi:hypothetical protein